MEVTFGRERIRSLFGRLSDLLKRDGIRGEVLLFGGAAMLLGWNSRRTTRDIDAVFEPASKIRRLVGMIADEEGLPTGWLNDAVKGFVDVLPARRAFRPVIFSTEHLHIYTPPPEYLIAMKSLAARTGPEHADAEDMIFLIRAARLRSAESIFKLVRRYYPDRPIPARTRFFVESIFEEIKKRGSIPAVKRRAKRKGGNPNGTRQL